MNLKTVQISGINFADTTLSEISKYFCSSSSEGICLGSVHLVPAGSIYFASKNLRYFEVLHQSICLPDGKSITTASAIFGKKILQIRGADLFREVLNTGRLFELRHFLLGTTENNLTQIQSQSSSLYPGVAIVGKISPPFRALTSAEIDLYCEEILLSGAQIVWVGLGAPQQDLLAFQIAKKTGKTAIAVGAAFDFFTGAQKEAPPLFRALGLEWFYRFSQNPSRLWKRYLLGNLVFVTQAIAWKLFPKRMQISLDNKLFIQNTE